MFNIDHSQTTKFQLKPSFHMIAMIVAIVAIIWKPTLSRFNLTSWGNFKLKAISVSLLLTFVHVMTIETDVVMLVECLKTRVALVEQKLGCAQMFLKIFADDG